MYSLPTEQHPDEAMENIRQGAVNHRTVAIRYRDNDNELSERIVEPYEFKNGKLYVYCLNKDGIRAFATTKILAAVVTDDAYEPRFPIKIQPTVKS